MKTITIELETHDMSTSKWDYMEEAKEIYKALLTELSSGTIRELAGIMNDEELTDALICQIIEEEREKRREITEMKKLTKLKNIIDKLEDGTLPRGMKDISLLEIRLLQDTLYYLKQGQTYETITKSVADICVDCGLTVEQQGIGWIITT